MKINKTIAAILIAGTMLLSGCSEQELPGDLPIGSSSRSEIADPLEEPVDNSEDSAQLKLPASGCNYSFDPDKISISEDGLIISPTIKGHGSDTNIGIVVFIDGVRQKYSVGDSAEKSYMANFDIKANSEQTLNLKVDAVLDGSLDKHLISMGVIMVPDFVSTAEDPTFGMYHNMLSTGVVELPEEVKDAFPNKNYNVLKTENSLLTQKQIDKFRIEIGDVNESGICEDVYLLQGDNRLEDRYTMPEGESKIKLHFSAYTTQHTLVQQRVTFYVNHEAVKFNGGYDHLDFTAEGEKITELDVELDNVKQGDFIYCITVPLSSEGWILDKTRSCLIIPENQGDKPSPSSSSTESSSPGSNNSDNSSSSGTSDNTPSSVTPDKPGAVTAVSFAGRIVPEFSIGENIYATERHNGAALCKIDPNGKVIKKLSGGGNCSVHGDKIMTYSSSDGDAGEKVKVSLLDQDLNEIKKLEIEPDGKGSYRGFDADENRIAYIYVHDDTRSELRICDWNFKNQKTLMELPADNSFGEIRLAEKFVAFKFTGNNNSYYGICDFNGNAEKHPKKAMSTEVQRIGNTALWSNKHGETTSEGEIILFKNGKFEVVKPQNPFESQDVYLTAEDEFFTAPDGHNVLKQYINGVESAELSLDKGDGLSSVIRARDKIVAGTFSDDGNKLKIWELKR